MHVYRRFLAALAIGLVPFLAMGTAARADVTNSTGDNIHEGDAQTDATQGGSSGSGDAVGGQVSGLVVSGGQANLDAKNRSEDVDVTSGPADASNTSASVVGLSEADEVVDATDITGVTVHENLQEGDDSLDLVQTANASSGDAVGGQVIGAVVSAGTTDIVADNASEDVDATTGDATADNDASAIVGQDLCAGDITNTVTADVIGITGGPCSVQDGDNDLSTDQTAGASSGDSVGGQVIGAVSSGDTSIDAKNTSTDVDLDTGPSTADNSTADVVGHSCVDLEIDAADVIDVESACTLQDGDNAADVAQSSTASSGDGVGGEVIGAVTSAGGSSDIVAVNSSEDVDAETGDATADNDSSSFTGLQDAFAALTADVSEVDGDIAQDGDNDATVDQTSSATSGDGVAGLVVGSVSSGRTAIDVKNSSEDVDLDTGVALADDSAGSFVGHACAAIDVDASDVTDSSVDCTVQDGDNSGEISQSSTASTGDAVGGAVVGAVTTAGGSSDIVAGNRSKDVDGATGDATANNDAAATTGVLDDDSTLTADLDSITDADAAQDGDNDSSIDQVATATSGDGVGGLVIGSVSSGATSIDAENSSEDVDLDTGVATADNSAASWVGLNAYAFTIDAADVTNSNVVYPVQDGDDSGAVAQTADASTGDAVGGTVVGAVTTAGGSTDVVTENRSEDVDISTGDATGNNDAAVGTGLNENNVTFTADITNVTADPLQEGDDESDVTQSATASSGDGVGGLVVGAVSSGDTSIDAKNVSEDVDLDTGEANADNNLAAFVGLGWGNADLSASDVTNIDAVDIQDGDNTLDADQTSAATTGDAVGGLVVGAVTSAGASADIVADNASEDVDAKTGEATTDNAAAGLVGMNAEGDTIVDVGDVTNTTGPPGDILNLQDGDNDLHLAQTAEAASGDGVGGAVLGVVVSGGSASVDAKNRSTDVDLDSGEANAANAESFLVGLAAATNQSGDIDLRGADVTNVDATNVLDGDNSSDADQSASASSGDAVAGLVAGGVVTGGNTDAVLDNASEDVDAATGESTFANDDTVFVGLAFAVDELVVG